MAGGRGLADDDPILVLPPQKHCGAGNRARDHKSHDLRGGRLGERNATRRSWPADLTLVLPLRAQRHPLSTR